MQTGGASGSGGAWHRRHLAVVLALSQVMSMSGGKVTTETAVVGTGEAALRTDVDATFVGLQPDGGGGVHLRTDVAITSPTKASGLARAAQHAGAAASTREAAKQTKYKELCAPAEFGSTALSLRRTGGPRASIGGLRTVR